MEPAIQRLYRVQLRTARFFDRNPALKPLLCMPGVDLIGGSSPTARAVKELAAAATSGGENSSKLYQPSPGSLFQLVRQKYSEPLVISEGEAEDDVLWRRMDAAFNAQRALVFIADAAIKLAQAAEHSNVPPAIVRQGAVLREAEALTPGCLLVEHPSVLRPGRALVFVYDISQNLMEMHGNEDWVVRGYVINRPFPQSVAEITGNAALGALGQVAMFHGGGDDDKLAVIHSLKSIPGAAAVDESDTTLYVGGSAAALSEALESGAATPADLKVVLGSVVLPLRKDPDTGALELIDADRYAFTTGAAVRDLVLHQPLQPPTAAGAPSAPIPPASMRYDYARFWHQNATWRTAVRLLAQGMDPTGASPSWKEVRAFADLHAAMAHYIAAALPLPYKSMDAAVEAQAAPAPEQAGGQSEGGEQRQQQH